MKKTVLAALAVTAALSTSAQADGWRLFPIFTDSALKFEPTLALTVNRVDPDEAGSQVATAYGIDFNFNCGLIQDPQNRIRTHLNISRSEKNGVEVTGYELSPRYTVPLGGGWSAGVGPSLAIFDLETATAKSSYSGLGLAAGVNYRAGAYYAGADLRYHGTDNKHSADYDNLALGIKVGVNF